jgi:hypothetical protein
MTSLGVVWPPCSVRVLCLVVFLESRSLHGLFCQTMSIEAYSREKDWSDLTPLDS